MTKAAVRSKVVVLLLLVHCLFLLPLLFFPFGPCFVMQCLVHLAEEEIAGCFI